MAFKARLELTGTEDVIRRLAAVDTKVRNRLLRKAITAAGRLILTAAKARVPRRTGLLRKSLGVKVKVYRKTAGVAVVGPRSGFKRAVKLPSGSFQVENPTKVAHLVEKGRRAVYVKTKRVLSTGAVIFGTKVASVPARPFLRPALDQNRAAAEQAIQDTIRAGLETR